ncbi:chemotaxis protein CheW [Leptolyngbya sp. FACHB-17]|uniref:chemotaxis protein CheW n=1 Tax=unclassified Leptolyngbya TaxID=2650499 RepID=UPI001680829B|nr:chemotaxis protein CheW [Leptolyngbya sp. FACHB-17]MBD2081754.1 purine-binding chemotaxis protein CheW [Leptolyngbya sp. FACHB-17]
MITIDDINDCWNRIGVEGNQTCEQLAQVTHCHNCSVYSESGRLLLERDVPIDYVQEWTTSIAERGSALSDRSTEEMLSLILFRLGQEQFAISIRSLQEVIRPTRIHKLPRRSDRLFLGLTNVRGEVLLCASLREFLNLEAAASSDDDRMLIVGTSQRKWVFPVDQVHGIHRYPLRQIQAPPVVITKTNAAYTQGILICNDQKVNYLNAELLIDTLDRRLL